jgi:hypothetical protein
MNTTFARWSLVCGIATTTLLACGGSTDSDSTTAAGSTSTAGGTRSVGGNGSGGAGAIGGTLCCNSTNRCHDGDSEIANANACPAGASCYEVLPVCCSPTKYCATVGDGGSTSGGATGTAATGNVAAAPARGGSTPGGTTGTGNVGNASSSGGVGNVGNGGASGAAGLTGLGGWSWGSTTVWSMGGACSPPSCAAGYLKANTNVCVLTTNDACYSMTDCGYTTVCSKPAFTCDRAAQYNRKYQHADTSICHATSLTCTQNTARFDEVCGCGCEQDAGCPKYVDCMPGSSLDPLCSDSTRCPFTLRAL